MSGPAARVRASKFISLVLRHRPQDFAVTLDAAGWTDIAAVITGLAAHGYQMSKEDLLTIVRTSDKQRFAVGADGCVVSARRDSAARLHASCCPIRSVPSPLRGPSLDNPAPGAWTTPPPGLLGAIAAMLVAGAALAFVYVSSAAVLWQRERPRDLLKALAPVGRMALTNYLLQSLVCTSLFYGYGLGLLGKVGAAGALAISAAIFTAPCFFSRWWLTRFRFGPAEWLWRSLTYGASQPMRRPPDR